MYFKKFLIDKKNIFILFFSILYFYRIFFFPESFGSGGSEIANWSYFKDYLNGFKDFDYTGFQSIRWNYAEFRWGFFLVPGIFSLFFDNDLNVLFLTTPIIVFFAYIIFVITLKNYLSIFTLIFFSLTWVLHPEINDFIYAFATNGVSLFVLSIIIYFCHKYDLDRIDIKFKIFLLLIFFWFYGVKETNLVFFLFLLYFLFKNSSLRNFLILVIISFSLYFIESTIVYYLSDKSIAFGRIFYHFFSSAPEAWNNFILNNSTKFGIDVAGKKEFSTNLADGAIFSRWHFTGLTPNFYYYIALLLSINNVFDNRNRFIKYISILYLSYFIMLSFLLVQLFPPKPFIHLNHGIQVIGFPLALIIFCDFFEDILSKLNKFNLKNFYKSIFIVFIFVLLNLKSLNHYYKVGYKDILSTNYNLFNVNKYLDNFSKKINNADCLLIKGSPLHLYHIIGGNLKPEHKKNIKEFVDKDKKNFLLEVHSRNYYKLPNKEGCDNTVKIYRFK